MDAQIRAREAVDQSDDLTPEEERELGRLLDKVAARVRRGVKFPIPEAAYEPLHRVVPYPAIDQVIVDDRGRVLMVLRDDKYFKGWELVGGYGHWPESLSDWCNRLALRDVGATVELRGFTGIHKWMPGEHAHGAPISMVSLSRLTSPPTRKDVEMAFFERAPRDTVPNHARFVDITIEAMQTGEIIKPL